LRISQLALDDAKPLRGHAQNPCGQISQLTDWALARGATKPFQLACE
jgi:hypothetical protein